MRWRAEITSGSTQQTERTKENPESAPEAEAVTFGIGIAQAQHSRTRRYPTNFGLSDIVGGVIPEFAELAGETMKKRGTRWHLVPRFPQERYDVDHRHYSCADGFVPFSGQAPCATSRSPDD